ncbi:MAG: exosortase/archaeosortase family protein [Sedimentisphaerales bacterium]|nr:exosortase/archaeosortase family protein [Sedimentisphaerales bacterium]
MYHRSETGLNSWAGTAAKLVVLLILFAWMFRPELAVVIATAKHSSEWVHALIVPVMIVLLAYHRRAALAERVSRGSLWGFVLIAAGLALYAAATWPFSYGYVRDAAMIPVLAGIVLVVCGWRGLGLSLPMLLLCALAIPLGARIYARLIIRPETYTIAAVAKVLDMLPGVGAAVEGVDIFFNSTSRSGVVALGQSNRGAQLLMACAVVGVFVVFSRIRTFRRLVFAAFLTIPVILLCNFSRLLSWGLLQIYVVADPTSVLPRCVSTVISLFLSYILFVLAASAEIHLFSDVDQGTVIHGKKHA